MILIQPRLLVRTSRQINAVLNSWRRHSSISCLRHCLHYLGEAPNSPCIQKCSQFGSECSGTFVLISPKLCKNPNWGHDNLTIPCVDPKCGQNRNMLPWAHSYFCGMIFPPMRICNVVLNAIRFISPAVVSPEIVDVEVPNNENTRRGLKLIAKIIQNLANNIFFGKEPHMTPLNRFLESNITNVTRFLSELHVRVYEIRNSVLNITSFRNMEALRMTSTTTGQGRRPTKPML